jgi:hypothetical protein
MPTYTVDLSPECVEDIMRQDLSWQLAALKENLEHRMHSETSVGYFYNEKEKDIAELTKYIAAFTLVLSYYTVEE